MSIILSNKCNEIIKHLNAILIDFSLKKCHGCVFTVYFNSRRENVNRSVQIVAVRRVKIQMLSFQEVKEKSKIIRRTKIRSLKSEDTIIRNGYADTVKFMLQEYTIETKKMLQNEIKSWMILKINRSKKIEMLSWKKSFLPFVDNKIIKIDRTST